MEGKEKKIKKNKVLPSQDEEVSDEVLEEIEAQIEVDEDWEDEEAAPVTAIPSKIIVVEESEIVLSDEPKKRELKAEDVAVDIDENSNDNKRNEQKAVSTVSTEQKDKNGNTEKIKADYDINQNKVY